VNLPIQDIYLMASFNNWTPHKLEAWEKKLLLIQDHEEIDKEMTQVREHLKQLELP
jgi:hypothetical protein